MRTSIELIPRTLDSLVADIRCIRARFPGIDTINIPDRASWELRSWEAAALAQSLMPQRIPHLRASDFTTDAVDELVVRLRAGRILEVVVIAGDPPRGADPATADPAAVPAPTTLIRALAAQMPELTVYAGLDPHRYRDDGALAENLAAKRDAGAGGFFSQPLFALDEYRRCREIVPDVPVFWGLSPVTSPRGQRYWERVNHVRFAAGFEPSLGWSQRFALELLTAVAGDGGNAYLMPIKVDVEAYLSPIFERIG